MKDDPMPSVDDIVTKQPEGVLGERVEDEDVMVDVVGAADDDHHHGTIGVGRAGSECLVEKCSRKETDMEQVEGSVGIRVLTSEKNEVMVNEEGLKRSADGDAVASGSNGDVDDIDSSDLTKRGLAEEAVEMNVESVEKDKNLDMLKIAESRANIDSEEVHMVVVDEGFASKNEAEESVTVNNPSSSTEVINKSKDESMDPTITIITNEKIGKGNEVLHSSVSEPSNAITRGSEDKDRYNVPSDPTIELTIKDSEKINNGTGAVDAKLAVESSSVEPQFGGETAVVDKETKGDLNKDGKVVELRTESVQEVASGDAMDEKTEKENEEDLTKKHEAPDSNLPDPRVTETDDEGKIFKVEHPATSDMSRPGEEQGLVVEAVNTGSIIDTTVCVKPSNDGEVPTGHTKISISNVEVPSTIEMNGFQVPADAFEEIDGVAPLEDVAKHSDYSLEDAEGMDIDEVLGWKDDDMPGIDVTSGAENDHFNRNSEAADAEQRLPESSCEPVLVVHQEENLKSREPIVYGRRAHVEVPVYDSRGSGSPLLGDDNLEIETDTDEEEETYHESVQEHEFQLTELSVPGSSYSLHQSRYFQPPENEGEFSVSDLVWGKVRSHPWWPGQIVDPSHASNKAMKYHKKDCFLVAYFGDGTFAWNDSTVLKPFRANFSQIEKHTKLEAFKNAVECALEEVTRRVELGLACSCVSKDVYKKLECQVIENGGVRKKYSTRHGKDESCSSSSFEPDKLVDYVRLLAQFPGEGDRMELAMAKAQLSSYCRFKGYRELPEFHFYGDLVEDAEKLDKNVEKVENNLIENTYPNKEISLSDLTDDAPESGYVDIITSKSVSSSGYKKRKARDSISNGSVKRQNRQPDKVSAPPPISTPKPSFKIGALIQRVASQLTGPTPLKSNTENGQHVDLLADSPVENIQMETSVADMLSQLLITAQDPMKRYGFLQNIIPFFYDRRAAVFTKSLKKNYPSIEKTDSGRKRKATNENDPEEFEFDFDEINDSYWTDRVIQNHSEDPLQQDHQNGGIDYQQVVAHEQEIPKKRGRKKRIFSTDHKVEVKVESEADKRRRENLATEIVLKFAEGIYFPPEIQLNKMFRRFGSLMESETEVDRQGGRARVVFKKCCDAEVAHSSAERINIFGSIAVNYELNYTPLVSYKPLPLLLLQNPMDAS